MAIGFRKGGGNHTETGGTVSYTFTGDVTAGDLLVVGVGRTKDGTLEPIDIGDIQLDGTSTATIGSWTMDVSQDAENFQSSTYDLSTAMFSTIVTGTGSCKLNFSGGTSPFIQCLGALTLSGSWDATRVEDTASTSYLLTDVPSSGQASSAGAAAFVGMLHLLIGDETITLDNDAAYGTPVYESFGQFEATISFMYRLVGTPTTDSADWEYNHTGPGAPCLVVYREATGGTPTVTQDGYRWRLDDGDQANATWAAAQDAGIAAPANAARRLRVLLDTSGDANATQYQLEYKEANDANWTKVI